MPIIRNYLNIQGGSSNVAALLDFIAHPQYGRGSMDFNAITPMPKWVYRQPTNRQIIAKYGEENCARGWCSRHWGVEQNALHPDQSVRQYDGGSAVRFDTANRDVRDLMRKLSCIFPTVFLDYLWASEDIGSSVGVVQYKDGAVVLEHYPSPGSRDAIDRSLDILGASPAEYGLVLDAKTGKYVYSK